VYKKEITHYEIVFTEAEHARMIAIKHSIRKIISKPMYKEQEVIELLSELEQILEGEWCEPMPF
jgi:hypothetical protein